MVVLLLIQENKQMNQEEYGLYVTLNDTVI